MGSSPELPPEFLLKAPLVLATKQVCGAERLPILFAFRTAPNNQADSGWKFWSGHEDQEYISDSSNTVVCSLASFLEIDESLQDILDSEPYTAWERENIASNWRQVYDYFEQ